MSAVNVGKSFSRSLPFFLFLFLSTVSIFSSVMHANNFEAVEEYMHKKYIRGRHNTYFSLPTHENFTRDFETNQLLGDFKKALAAGDVQAKRVFESVLSDLKTCLSAEKEYGPKAKLCMRRIMGAIIAGGLLGASLSSEKIPGFMCSVLWAIGLGLSFLWDKEPKNQDVKNRLHYRVLCFLFCGGSRGRYAGAVEDLEKRVEFWSQLVPDTMPVQ